MKKFTISSQITISVYTVVEAETEEKALEEAANRSVMSLCWVCATGHPKEEWVTGGELDGTPSLDDANIKEVK